MCFGAQGNLPKVEKVSKMQKWFEILIFLNFDSFEQGTEIVQNENYLSFFN